MRVFYFTPNVFTDTKFDANEFVSVLNLELKRTYVN